MKQFGFLCILSLLVLGCQNDYSKTKKPYQFIPNKTQAVIVINELSDFSNSLSNNAVLSSIYKGESSNISEIFKNFNTTNQVFIAFPDSINSKFLILTKNDSLLFVTDELKNHSTETLVDSKIKKTTIDTTVFYHQIIGNTFAGSNNINLLKSINPEQEDLNISKMITTADNKSVASVVFKSNQTSYSKLMLSDFIANDNAKLALLDFNLTSKRFNYNGLIKSKDSSINYLNSFKNTIPQKTNTIHIAPQNTSSLLSIAFDDFTTFSKNLDALLHKEDSNRPAFLNFTNEIATIDNALVLHSLDPNLIKESIEEKSLFETFRDIDIYANENPNIFDSSLKPFMSFRASDYFAVFERFVIFTSSIEDLKSILTDALNDNTLAALDSFVSISKNLSDESSVFIFKDSKGLTEILNKDMNGYNANAVQFIHENNYTHINGIMEKYTKRAATNSVNEVFTTPLEAAILTQPQTVKNHTTKAHDIIVQDVNNVLYLISSAGNILWKKQLKGKVLGQIEQIDIYKNGRLQLAFATENEVYVLDRNGNDVSPYPLKFNDKITQPLSVFDYDKQKNYRLLVTQGKNLLMYDAKGKQVKGFNYKANQFAIKTQPKHFRIGSKDFIVFGAGETLHILNRQGNTRINVKDKIRFSKNPIFLYQNKFTTTNTLGQLIQVDTKGKSVSKHLNLTSNHNLFTTSKTLVTLSENQLKIKSKTVNLDYGEYTTPEIFYLNDKIYITTTDLQTKKVYLFDSQGKSIPNFPVFGTAAATLQKLDSELGLELITQSDDHTIVVYKLH
ncbi:ribonuclease HII [Winogradskyella eckloniae]|uniref:ribonuclease HII n=1 Tax=Winogradskyella eckloniae TaxID=1089306 RepID=UPI001565FE2F|nr:ribonuclease HII [Winogradskyella eckloniae]NRD19454.1 ribonuclease HII [Winogradskyella eckloniae]